MINRREMLGVMAADLGSAMLPSSARPANKKAGSPMRIIFFLQNHGFDPLTCIPKGLHESCALDGVTLEEPMQALEPYKDRMHIITGLHGRHTSNNKHWHFFIRGFQKSTLQVRILWLF